MDDYNVQKGEQVGKPREVFKVWPNRRRKGTAAGRDTGLRKRTIVLGWES